LALDPDFARAHAHLAASLLFMRLFDVDPKRNDEFLSRAEASIHRALALDPDQARAIADLAWISNAYDRDLPLAVRYTERALALDPGNTQVLFAAGLMARSLGRLDTATAVYRRLIALDPATPGAYGQLGKVLAFSGSDEQASSAFRKVIELSPAFPGVRHWLSLVLLGDGRDRAKAEQSLALAAEEPGTCYRLEILAMSYHALGRAAESDAAMTELVANCEEPASYNIAYTYASRGEPDLAFAWLEKALQHNDGGMTELIIQPMFAPLHDDPRWLPFLRKFGRAPEQLAAIPFNVTLPQ